MLITDNVYMVPRVIAVALKDGVTSSYVSKADCFVRGNPVCFYYCRHPFNKDDMQFNCIQEGRLICMNVLLWENETESANQLVRALLEVNPF